MKRIFICLALLLFFGACAKEIPTAFNRKLWLANSDPNLQYNPRAYMTDDLIGNYLAEGISREAIISLLGKPYKQGVELRLPDDMQLPDSISFSNEENLKLENADKSLNRFNEFFTKNAQPDTLLYYAVGWSTIDPNSLTIKLDDKGKLVKAWVEQH